VIYFRYNFPIIITYIRTKMKMTFKTLLITSAITAAGLSFTACTTTQPAAPKPQVKQVPAEPVKSDAQKHAEYKSTMKIVGNDIKRDANYKRLDLSTPELKNWFTDITYKLWDGQISRGEFIAAGLEKFPGHSYEFEVISNGLISG